MKAANRTARKRNMMLANAHVFRLTIVVHPGHRGRGIGREMLGDLLAWAAGDARV